MDILISLLIYCAILGVIWWILSIIPMPPPLMIVARVVFGIIALLLLLSLLGVFPSLAPHHYWRSR